MALSEQQKTLALLYTQPQLREEFLQDPRRMLQKLQHSEEDIEVFMKASLPELRRFAQSLFRKRYQCICKILPLAKEILSEKFSREFCDFHTQFNPKGINKHYHDALAFIGVLIDKEASKTKRELLTYEKIWLEMYLSPKPFRVRLFTISLKKAVKDPHRLVRKLSLAVWYHKDHRTHLKIFGL
ncbi:hypothetical protein [Candidatus Uabimicrobium amorphum]|uniref:Uncharacterized protein n=1 Tax=Uabimicrobium amorphum TaxID=2596890 RepID=A0A5S9IJ25_UABAM|nr:hypothetical protein [Candidatus Uabimicrobium amorphum]BBM82799.1 hypothetical protein UABAM_01142 [Candidatus Uabimicrobium amorphum]